MRELARLLYLIVVVAPLTLLALGPLLTLAALRGMQRIGPIVFNPARRGTAGRVGALVLGLLVWLAVWGGLAALLGLAGLPALSRAPSPGLQAYLSATLPPSSAPGPPTARSAVGAGGIEQGPSETPALALAPTPQPTVSLAPSPTLPIEAPTPSPSPSSTSIPPSPTSPPPAVSAQPLHGTLTPTVSIGSASPGIGSPARTAEPGRAVSLGTATPPPSPPSSQPSTAAPSPTLAATLSFAQREEAISAVETANELLRAAVAEASSDNLAALEGRWQGRALTKAQDFAQDLYERYSHPLQVTFEYRRPHSMQQGASPAMAVITSTEVWTYAGPNSAHTEGFEFIYTLSQQGEGWVITDYTYRNAPALQPSPTPGITSPITATITLTATTASTPAAP